MVAGATAPAPAEASAPAEAQHAETPPVETPPAEAVPAEPHPEPAHAAAAESEPAPDAGQPIDSRIDDVIESLSKALGAAIRNPQEPGRDEDVAEAFERWQVRPRRTQQT